jgi:hypothetical protein
MPRGKVPYTQEEFEQKFWENVDKTSDPQGCWLWTAGKSVNGYGRVRYNGKLEASHRIAYMLSGNTIPVGLELAHSQSCRGKKNCCNPAHLTPKTHGDNILDKYRDGTTSVKLSDQQVLDIRSRINQTQLQMANEFGLSQSTISDILNRRTWSHI